MTTKKVPMRVACLECQKKFRTTKDIPECPRCGGSDIELDELYVGGFDTLEEKRGER